MSLTGILFIVVASSLGAFIHFMRCLPSLLTPEKSEVLNFYKNDLKVYEKLETFYDNFYYLRASIHSEKALVKELLPLVLLKFSWQMIVVYFAWSVLFAMIIPNLPPFEFLREIQRDAKEFKLIAFPFFMSMLLFIRNVALIYPEKHISHYQKVIENQS
jgi:hypothetical protein